MKALSIQQPWAWLIVNAGKNIENRTRRTNHRGPVLIHASQTRVTNHVYNQIERDIFMRHRMTLPPRHYMGLGGIVGIAEIVDCITESSNPWFTGPFGYVLANVRPLPFTPTKGRLGVFEVPDETVKRLGLTP